MEEEKRMTLKRTLSLLLAGGMSAAVLAGCGSQAVTAGQKKEDEKIAISMYM